MRSCFNQDLPLNVNAIRYNEFAIRSFRSKDAEALANGKRVKQFAAFERAAQRKPAMLDAAEDIEDLRAPTGNRLEKLAGDREGQHSDPHQRPAADLLLNGTTARTTLKSWITTEKERTT